jgi:hypothetical protein
VCALAVTGGIALSMAIPTPAVLAAGNTETGLWTGHGHAVRTAGLGLVSVTTRYDSEFWFVVADDATISGEATVSYDLMFDDSRLRSLITAMHFSTNYSVAAIPGIGGLLNGALATKDLLGMRMQYQEFAPIRRGPIVGTVTRGRVHLQWAGSMLPIPYQDYAVYPFETRPSKSDTHPAYPPWIGDAEIAEPVKGHLVATTPAAAARYQKGPVIISAIWSAGRQN